jgi:predicted transcriptional regulator with HTH domain
VRAVINGIEVEGSPEEIARFVAAVGNPTFSKHVADDEAREVEASEEFGITENFAYRALKRLPLSNAQKSLLGILKKAHPEWVSSSELQRLLKCPPTSLGGVFGGLGRRVSTTKGYQQGFSLWKCDWDEDEGEWAYRLPDASIAALIRAGL